jgi:hypothetical protein
VRLQVIEMRLRMLKYLPPDFQTDGFVEGTAGMFAIVNRKS